MADTNPIIHATYVRLRPDCTFFTVSYKQNTKSMNPSDRSTVLFVNICAPLGRVGSKSN